MHEPREPSECDKIEQENMAWYQRSKLVLNRCRTFAWGPQQLAKTPNKRIPNMLASPKGIGCLTIAAFCGIAITIGSNMERVPYSYSNRTHLVLVPRYLEKKMRDSKINKIKEEFKDDWLPPQHPHTERVRLIVKNMIESPLSNPRSAYRPCSLAKQFPDYLNWEVTVIDKHVVTACCYGGKVVVSTGLLNSLESDAEIAYVIGHEIGHDLARHASEKITKSPRFAFRQLYTWFFIDESLVPTDMSVPSFKKIEREADYIGLLLMACAGYDPRIAPTVFERLRKRKVLSDYCSAPRNIYSETADFLSNPEFMDDALFLYEVRKAGGIKEYYVRKGKGT